MKMSKYWHKDAGRSKRRNRRYGTYSASLISSCSKRRSVAVKDGSCKQIGVSISISSISPYSTANNDPLQSDEDKTKQKVQNIAPLSRPIHHPSVFMWTHILLCILSINAATNARGREGSNLLYLTSAASFQESMYETRSYLPCGKQQSVAVIQRQGKIEGTAHCAPHLFTSSVLTSHVLLRCTF